MSAAPKSVLFVCSLNAVRSPIAEGLTRALYGDALRDDSAGLRAGSADGFAMAVMMELGIYITNHVPKSFEELEQVDFDLVIALSSEAYAKAQAFFRHTDATIEFWPTDDATCIEAAREQKLVAYRAVRDGLAARIKQRFGGM